MLQAEVMRNQQLDELTKLLQQKGNELDKLIEANCELWEKLKNDDDVDFNSITRKSERITQNLTKIEKHIDDVMMLNHGFRENLHTDRIVAAAQEISNRAAKLFESFEKVIALLNLRKDGVLENLASIQGGGMPIRSYLRNS